MKRADRIVSYSVFILVLVLFSILLIGCEGSTNRKHTANLNLILEEPEALSASVTGKELLWSKSQIKRKDNTGKINFEANIDKADLLMIKCNTSYKYLRCYLEAGQDLNVIFNAHQYKIVGNSIAARQNRLIVDIDKMRATSFFDRNEDSIKKEETAQKTYKDIDRLISKFKNSNKDASSPFIRFIRFDNKYAYLKSKGADLCFTKNYNALDTKETELLMQTVLMDSDFNYAYFSEYYRYFLAKTMHYIRSNNKEFILKATENPVKNEWLLASYLKKHELQAYQMAVSLKELFPIDCDINLKKAIDRYSGYWKNFLQEEYKLANTREYTKHRLKKDSFNTGDLYFVLKDDIRKKLSEYSGKWVFLGIGRNQFGYSSLEASHLEDINQRLPDLNCFCVSPVKAQKPHGNNDLIQTIFNSEEELKNAFQTQHLPYSLLINPQGNIELVNLPTASSGMLESMLHKIME